MQSSNPMFQRVSVLPAAQPMTVQGAINKTLLLTGVATVVALLSFVMMANHPNSLLATAGWAVGGIGGFILALIITFKPETGRALAIPYAGLEGLFLGAISAAYNARYPGLPLTAMAATFITTFALLGLYKAGIIRATERFKSIIISATLALALLFVVQLVMSLAFGSSIPFLFGKGPVGIGFAAFVAVIASLNLILDFDLIERSAEYRAPQSFEWFCVVALLATLVWMYVSFLRLLGLTRD